jgi:predicted ATPase
VILTPDQRLRVFVSSTLRELAPEREAVRDAIDSLHLHPVMFEAGARPHPPRPLYRAYLAQSDVFVGVYWESYGWVAPGEEVSGLGDEYRLAGDRPRLIYVKAPAPGREPGLAKLLDRVRDDDRSCYRSFETADELRELVENDLALVLTESFAEARAPRAAELPRSAHDNLPVQRGSLVDRTQEVAVARELLLRDDVGLVTLTGAGGTGKTRLALHVATMVREAFEDGVVFVPLASLAESRLVPAAIAKALDLHENPGQSFAETLGNYLRTKQLLLVLDNFEHLLDAAALVSQLLERCPRLTVLVTSRSLLHLYEEKELAVPPLGLPAGDVLPELERLSQYAAVELFIQRAREVKPDFMVSNESAPAVAQICQRLDGLPLAIELAAARARLFPPKALLARLDRRLPLLVAGARDLPERQQTLRGAIDWSYDLLDDDEKRLFRRASVFVGGFTPEAAEMVCANRDDPRDAAGGLLTAAPSVSALLESLLDKSLAWVQEGAGGEPRFGMLETIREYGRMRLAESGEEDETIARHGQWSLQLVEAAEPGLWGPERRKWVDVLSREVDNLRAALRRGLTQRRAPEVGVQMVTGLLWFWVLAGQSLAEGSAWLTAALAATDPETRPVERGRVLWGIGALAYIQGDLTAAVEALEKSLELLRQTEQTDSRALAGALAIHGTVLTVLGRTAAAEAVLREGLDLCRANEDRFWEAYMLYAIGEASLSRGNREAASASFRRGLEIAEELGDPWTRMVLVVAHAKLAAEQNEPRLAFDLFSEAIPLTVSQDQFGRTRAVFGAASAATELEDYDRAVQLWKESLRIAQELGNPSYTIVALASLADVALRTGDAELAARLFGAVSGRLETTGENEAAFVMSLYADTRYRASLRDALERARAALQEPAGLAAWREGEVMSLDAAAFCRGTWI